MTAPVPPLLAALLEPARYPHPVARVELMQTHSAWVLLAGDHVYKIKKPVHLSFMDFSTLAARRAACEAELRVNRRFATDGPAGQLYLEALPITGSAQAPVLGGDPAQAVEWAVHMRRFPEADRLDHVAQRGALPPEAVQQLARYLAAFQAGAAVADADSAWGQPEDWMALARDNTCTLRTLLEAHDAPDALASRAALEAMAAWTETQFAQLAPQLAQRRVEGRVREGHGDLHLANLVLLRGAADQVLPFDAIEFNDALRWIDVAADTAFLWMDLRRIGCAGLANLLLSEWLDASGDASAVEVWRLFAVYRAMVRAKVAGIRLGQPGAETAAALREVRTYLQVASAIAEPPAPRLCITHGLSGSGKTWASTRWLAGQTAPAIRLRSDVERKRLHGLAALQSSGSALNSGLYSTQAHGDTYASLLARSRSLLAEGWSVVVDAAFLRHHEREAFSALAAAVQCPFGILACEAPPAELRRRIRARQTEGQDASEATLSVLEQQLGWLEPLTDAERILSQSA